MATATAPLAGFRFEAPDPDPPEPRPAPGHPAPKADPVPAKDERFEALQRELDETRASNRQLMDLVGRQAPAAPTTDPKGGRRATPEYTDDIDWGDDPDPDPAAQDEPEDPAGLVDDISKLGAAALAKRGFVRAADVQKMVREQVRKAVVTGASQIVQRARAEVTTESSIMGEFPDLADPTSDLYKAAIPHIQAAVRLNPRAAKDPTTLYLAARAAKAELAGKGGGRNDDDRPASRGGRRELDDPDDRSDRDIRIASQAGDRGHGRSRIESDRDDDFVMTDDARSVAKMMGLTDDEYKKEATRIRVTSSQHRGRR